MKFPELVERAYHHPQEVMKALFDLKRGEQAQKHALLTPTIARGLAIVGSVLTLGAGVVWAGPLVQGAVNEVIQRDNEVSKRISLMYRPGLSLDSKTESASKPVEADLATRALQDYLRPLIGENFRIIKTPEPLIAQSVALDSGNRPLGHWYYDRPVRDLEYRTLTNGPGTGPTYDSIPYGTETLTSVDYWVITPGQRGGHNNVWLVTSVVNPVNRQRRYEFANDIDGNDPLGRLSFFYRTTKGSSQRSFAATGVVAQEALKARINSSNISG